MVIYITTNLINGKQYIGRDSHNNPNYYGSGPAIKNAIKKYGKENFKKEIIEECSSFENLVEREEYWLNYYDAGNNKTFYNLHNYGKGGSSDKSGKKNGMYGKNHSYETKLKIGNANRGRLVSSETRRKLSEAGRVRIYSNDTLQKMSESRKGEKHHFYGKKLSTNHREKLSKVRLGVKHKNSWSKESRRNQSENRKDMGNPNFKGYIVCIDGIYKSQSNTRFGWSKTLNISENNISSHLTGKKYKNGIKGNFFKWEHEV